GPSFSFKSGPYPGSGGDCGTMLASGASCTIVVTFTPAGAGPKSGTITLSYGNAQVTRQVSGTATDRALLTISDWQGSPGGAPNPFDYGVSGTPVDHTFTLQNVGTQLANGMFDHSTLAPGFAMKGGTYPGAGGTC